jgi:protein SCO1
VRRGLTAFAAACVLLAATLAAADQARPKALRDVGVEQKLDQPVPLDIPLRDEAGRTVRLGDFFGRKPVLLSLAYYHCPMLCPMILDGLVRSLRPLSWNVGEEFEVVTVSIDPRETPEQAAAKKQKLVADYGRKGAAEGWHFLVGDQDSVRRLTGAVGFRTTYDAEHDQFAHAAVLTVLTPQGKISRYLYGIDYAPRDVRLALVEASQDKIGTLADQILLFCYHYDPATGKYGMAALTSLRVAGLLTIVGLATFVVGQLRRENSKV